MRYSALTQRIAGEGAAAWQIHDRALELRAEGVDILLLSVGDPDFDTPLPIVHGAIDSLLAGDTHYPPVRGTQGLRNTIARRHRLRSGQDKAFSKMSSGIQKTRKNGYALTKTRSARGISGIAVPVSARNFCFTPTSCRRIRCIHRRRSGERFDHRTIHVESRKIHRNRRWRNHRRHTTEFGFG